MVELLLTIGCAGLAALALTGLETLPSYYLDYLLRSGLVYQGY